MLLIVGAGRVAAISGAALLGGSGASFLHPKMYRKAMSARVICAVARNLDFMVNMIPAGIGAAQGPGSLRAAL